MLAVNCHIAPAAQINGRDCWIEACRIEADVELAGENVLVGLDVDAPLALPRGACLEVLPGRNRAGEDVWFVRCHGIRDSFKDGLFFGRAPLDWLRAVGLDAGEVWPGVNDAAERTLWNARIFPAERSATGFRRWLWMFAPEAASAQGVAGVPRRRSLQRRRYRAAGQAGGVSLPPRGYVEESFTRAICHRMILAGGCALRRHLRPRPPGRPPKQAAAQTVSVNGVNCYRQFPAAGFPPKIHCALTRP
jgi:hypothetical protein